MELKYILLKFHSNCINCLEFVSAQCIFRSTLLLRVFRIGYGGNKLFVSFIIVLQFSLGNLFSTLSTVSGINHSHQPNLGMPLPWALYFDRKTLMSLLTCSLTSCALGSSLHCIAPGFIVVLSG